VLGRARPTAVNLRWALERMRRVLTPLAPDARARAAWEEAQAICDEDTATNRAIGEHGLAVLRGLAKHISRPLNIMTHCNAGWLATVDYGTALAPVYLAHAADLPVHVWVSETRPRNQGLLTAWELAQQNVPHTLVADSACGHLMQRGEVDVVMVGADRVACRGDVANKVGTYLKALAAHDSGVPFYAAVPTSTIDWSLQDGMRGIPIEERAAEELRRLSGTTDDGKPAAVNIAASVTAVANPAFDVTPARLITGLITERGVCAACEQAITALRPMTDRTQSTLA
jgi:methylthioribose-1-phosphate isomerase